MTDARPKLDTLTSLRFFAAMMIVLLHAEEVIGSLGISRLFALTQGVAFFFVLSGFILAYNYRDLSGPRDTASFLMARVARIWPVHIFCGILALAAAPSYINFLKAYDHPGIIIAANLFLIQAWIPMTEFFFSINGLSWSISTELFFYLAFPLILVASARYAKRLFLFSVVLLTLVLLISSSLSLPWYTTESTINGAGIIYINPISRIFEFILGVLLFRFWQNSASLWIRVKTRGATALEIIAIILSIVTINLTATIGQAMVTRFGNTFAGLVGEWLIRSGFPPVFAFLILVFSLQKGAVSRILKWPIFVLIGEISFSLYLIHQLLLYHFSQRYSTFLTRIPIGPAYSGFILASLCLSYLIYTVIEIPSRRWIIALRSRFTKPINSTGKGWVDEIKQPQINKSMKEDGRSFLWKTVTLVVVIGLLTFA